MLFCTLLPLLALRLLLDTRKAIIFHGTDGNPYFAHISPWRFFALKRSDDTDECDEIFVVRLFRGHHEWSVQFESLEKGYSFSRFCAEQTFKELWYTLRLLYDDAQYGFVLPF